MRRRMRQLIEFRKRFSARRSRGRMIAHEAKLHAHGTPTDVESVRAKSSRHRKSTADKWNQ